MKRVALAVLCAVTLAGAVTVRTGWSPACVAFERYSFEWYFLGCWYGEPPPNPEG
jgi:hypothetical protein